jgi:hypothetical protein
MQANYPPGRREMAGGRPTTGVQVADHVAVATSLAWDSTPERNFRILRIFRYPLGVGVRPKVRQINSGQMVGSMIATLQ